MMRKLTLAVCLLLCLSLFSCAKNNYESADELRNYVQTCERGISYRTIKEIDAYAALESTPRVFVHPKTLSVVGEFGGYLYFPPNNSHYHYQYNLIDANQYEFTFKVSHYVEEEVDKILEPIGKRENMLLSGGTESGWILQNDVKYWYAGGKLLSMRWYVDGIEFAVVFDEIGCYPTDGADTFIKKLLSTSENEVDSALREFITFFRKNR